MSLFPDHPGPHGPPPDLELRSGLVPLAFVVVALLAMTVIPYWSGRRIEDIRTRIAEVNTPARSQISAFESGIGKEVAAIRGYLLTGDPVFLRQYDSARVEMRLAREQLGILLPQVGGRVAEHLALIDSLIGRWESPVSEMLGGLGSREELIEKFSMQQALFQEILATGERIDSETARDIDEGRERIRRAEQWDRRLGLLLGVVAALGSIAVGLAARRSRRQARAIGAARMAAERQARELEQQVAASEALSAELKRANEELVTVNVAADSARDRAELERQRLRTVLEAIPVAVFIAGKDNRPLEANPAGVELWGDPPQVHGPEDYGAFRARHAETGEALASGDWGMARALATGEISGPEELDIETFHGEKRSILNYARPVLDAENEIVGGVAVNVDITDRKRAEQALRQSEERFRAVQETTPDGFMICRSVRDAEGNLADFEWIYLNPAAGQIVGREPGELTGKRVLEAMPAVRENGLFSRFARVVETGEAERFETHFPDGDRDRFFRGTAVRIDDGFAVSFQDVTQQKQVQLALDVERERLQRVFMQVPAIVAITYGPDHLLQSANRYFCDLVGQDAELGRPIRQAFPELKGEAFAELFDRVFETGEPFVGREVSASFQRHEGGPRQGFFNFVYQPLTDADDEVFGVLVHAVEVTEQVLARREVEAASQAKSDFMATMSHELRTPLNAMIGYTDLLLMGVPREIPEESRGQVDRIRLSANHLLQLIEEILTFSRLDAGRERLHIEDVNLADVLGEAAAIIEPLASRKGLRFACTSEVDHEVVRTDARKLRQILLNLLGNAIKFTQQGEVGLHARFADEGERLVLEVTDTGMGISPADQEQLFQAFWQADSSSTRAAEGTGLGLAITHRFVRLLGGEIEVHSEAGNGSTFTVSLPVEAPAREG